MKVLLNIPEETLNHYAKISKLQRQSRKAMMEMVLIQHVQNVDYGLPEGLLSAHSKIDPQTKEITSFKLNEVSIMPDGSHEMGISEVVVGYPAKEAVDAQLKDKKIKLPQFADEETGIIDAIKSEAEKGEVKIVYEAGGRGGGKTAKVKVWIERQIKAIEAEKIPKERNTPFGKKIWQAEQQKRIDELKQHLK